MKKIFSQFLLLIAAVAMIGCRADVDLDNLDPTMKVDMGLALPIGEISATVGDFLGSGENNIYVREDGVMYFRDTFSIKRQYHLIDLEQYLTNTTEDFKIKEKYGENITGGATPVVLEFPMVVEFNNINDALSLSNERIDSAIITNAQFTSSFYVQDFGLDFNKISKVEIIMPEEVTMADGSKSVEVPISGKGYNQLIPINISEFNMNLMKDKNQKPDINNVINKLSFKMRFTLNLASDETITATDASLIHYVFEINFLDYKAIYGWFKPSKQMTDHDQHVIEDEWPAWKSIKRFILPLNDPTIEAVMTTEVGAPLFVHVDYLQVTNSEGKSQRAHWEGSDSTIFELPNYVKVTDPFGTIAENRKTFSKLPSQGEIDKLLAIRPDIIDYSYYVSFNDNSYYATVAPQHRLTKNTDINVDAIITLPFIFNQGMELEYADTLKDVDIDKFTLDSLLVDVEQVDSINTKKLTLFVTAKNYLPFDIDCDLTFYDKLGQKIDLELAEGNHVHIAGPTNFDYDKMYFSEPGYSVFQLEVNQDNIDKVSAIKSIVYDASITDLDVSKLTKPNAVYPVCIRETTSLKLKIGIAADMEAYMSVDFSGEK